MNEREKDEIRQAVERNPSLARVAEALGVKVGRRVEGGDDPSLPLPDDPHERQRFLLGLSDWGE